ncbi:MAG: PAS domain S-box protein [Desulfosarcinaceae bacterium]|nr:PAS domain S-box protein [Desulfosarcinaceae bacterium]
MRLKLATRLTLLNIMICLGIGLILAIQFISYRKVEALLSEISQDHMDEVIRNAQNGRDLASILADINLLTHRFFEQDNQLKLMSGRILSDMTLLSQTNRDPAIGKQIERFTAALRVFFKHCGQVNAVLAERRTSDREMHRRLNALEEAITDRMIRNTLSGESTDFIEQLSLLVYGYRESLLEIGKHFAELRYDHFTDPFANSKRPVLDMLSDLKIRMRTLTAADQEIQVLATGLRKGIDRYSNAMLALYSAMDALRQARLAMRDHQGGLITAMAASDTRLAESAEAVDQVIKTQLQRTGSIVGVLALTILAGLITTSSHLLVKHVNAPMRSIQAGIANFSKGLLDTPIDLKRQDEWGVIEGALNRMATDLRTSYTALEISEKSYRRIFDNVSEGIFQTETTSSGSYFTKANPAMARLLGYATPQEVIQAYADLQNQLFVDPADGERLVDVLRDSERVSGFECQLQNRSGRQMWVAIGARLIQDEGGERFTIEGTMADISDRKAAEAALRESEDRYRTLVQASPSPIIVHQENRIVFANDAAVRSLEGKAVTDLLGRETTAFIHVDSLEIARERINKLYTLDLELVTGDKIPTIEEKFITLKGNTIDVLVAAVAITYEGQRAAQVVFQDISTRKRSEQEMVRLRNLLKNITDAMPSVLVAVDANARVTQWNREAERLTATPARYALKRPLSEVFPQIAEQETRIHDAIARRPFQPQATVNLAIGGMERICDIAVYPLTAEGVAGAVIRLDDVTDRLRMKEMMIQSEKMLSVGGLAAGMAHEINNPLAGILQNIQVVENRLMGELPSNKRAANLCGIERSSLTCYLEKRRIPEMLASVSDSGRRAARIVDNMLSFARKGDSARSSNDLATLMDLTIELAENDYDLKKKLDFRHIRIVKEYEPGLPPVPCSKSKIQQVLLNLLRNGAQAMATKRGSNEADSSGIPPQFNLRIQRLGNMARIEVEDNGPGMDEATCKRVFEPFFTTKGVGVGTGLGLSVSYFIITENHQGTMAVSSQPGKGSTFAIELPMSSH